MQSTKMNSFRTDKQLESGSLRIYVTDKQTKQNKTNTQTLLVLQIFLCSYQGVSLPCS